MINAPEYLGRFRRLVKALFGSGEWVDLQNRCIVPVISVKQVRTLGTGIYTTAGFGNSLSPGRVEPQRGEGENAEKHHSIWAVCSMSSPLRKLASSFATLPRESKSCVDTNGTLGEPVAI